MQDYVRQGRLSGDNSSRLAGVKGHFFHKYLLSFPESSYGKHHPKSPEPPRLNLFLMQIATTVRFDTTGKVLTSRITGRTRKTLTIGSRGKTMKIAWTRMKGVCLLLGLAMAGQGRSFAADINTVGLAAFVESSSGTTAGTATANPFKDESASTPAKAVSVEPAVPATSSPCLSEGIGNCADYFAGAPGRIWFRGEFLYYWPTGSHLPPMVETLTGQTGTTLPTVFGDRTVGDGSHEGYRTDIGMWLDCQ